jgi:hypothetical protein
VNGFHHPENQSKAAWPTTIPAKAPQVDPAREEQQADHVAGSPKLQKAGLFASWIRLAIEGTSPGDRMDPVQVNRLRQPIVGNQQSPRVDNEENYHV